MSSRQLQFACSVAASLLLSFSAACFAQETNSPKVREAKQEFEAAIKRAVAEYVAKLDTAAKAAAAEGDIDEAKSINDYKKSMAAHGISTQPDPMVKAKRILIAHTFRKTSGAILDFRPDYTAFGRHNGKFTNWVMTDPQTLITGATDPTKPIYIHKFDKQLTRGTVYKYQPVTNERRHTITRSRQ